MSTKDYLIIAAALKSANASLDVILAIAAALKEENPRFSLHLFMVACGK